MSILFSIHVKTAKRQKHQKSRSDELLREGSDGKFNDFKLITSWWLRFVDASLASPKNQALTNTAAASITSNRSLACLRFGITQKTSFAETFSCDSFQLLIFSHRNQSLIPIFSVFLCCLLEEEFLIVTCCARSEKNIIQAESKVTFEAVLAGNDEEMGDKGESRKKFGEKSNFV